MNHWQGKIWYAYGTSITSVAQGKYVPYLEKMLGVKAVNKGIPGGGITNLGGYSKGQVKEAVMTLDDSKAEADLITLEVGANDGGYLGDKFDTSEKSFAGCLNLCIRYLLANTKAQIVVFPSVATTDKPEDERAYYEKALMTEAVCKINRVYFLDGGSSLGSARISASKDYTLDSIHQTDLGGYNLAKYLYSKIKDIPLWYSELPEAER